MPQRTIDRPGDDPRGHRWTVRAHLALVGVVALVLAAAALGYGYRWSADRAQDDATDRMTIQAQVAAAAVDETIDAATSQAAQVAANPGIAAALDRPDACALVADGTDAFAVAVVAIVGAAGQVACSSFAGTPAPEARPYADADWLGDAFAADGPVVAWPVDDAVTGGSAVVVARSFPAAAAPSDAPTDPGADAGADPGADAEPAAPAVGAVAVVLPADDVAATLRDSLALPAEADVVVVDRDTGRVVSASDDGLARPGSPLFAGAPATGRWNGADDAPRVFASAEADTLRWRVYTALDHASVTAVARGTLTRQALAAGGALLVLVLALWLLERRVAGPLAALTRAAVGARDGSGSTRVPETGTAETAALARAFNSMLDIRTGQEARLAYGASHDRLTGLQNTESFRARLDASLAADPRPELVVLCVGLDRFQAVSDGIGTEGADRVLVEVAARLRGAVRPGDALARGDGERFFVACEGIDRDAAVELAERIHLVVAEPMGWPATGVAMQARIGLAVAGTHSVAEDLVRQAATATGDAQARGRSWSVFDDSMHVLAAHQLQTETGLRDALVHDQLVVHYQPIVETGTGRLLGAEALVRWHHPERGMVPPLEFIGVAERTGQIGAIGRLVLRQACAQAVRWAPADGPFTMSVNVAAEQLLDEGFADMVVAVLAETGLSPARLCLEVTESAVIRRVGSGAENLHRLRAIGVNIAVDDFGTGYSSLSYLKNLPITSLKIDRSFITRIEHDDRDRHLVQAVLGMAKALGLAVVAEGVETAGQRRLLEDLGCESAQGFLFGRPCATTAFSTFLADPVGVAP